MIKKCILILILSIFCISTLSGCKKTPEPEKATFEPQVYTVDEGISTYVKLYRLDDTKENVIPSVACIDRAKYRSLYEAVMDAILGTDGVYRENYSSVFSGDVKCYDTKKHENILYVNLSREFLTYSQEKMAAAILVIVQTFTQIDDIEYVMFSVEGRGLYLNGLNYRPLYAIDAQTTNIQAFLKNYQLNDNNFALKNTGTSEKVNSLLYFYDMESKFIIPQVRTILVRGFDYINVIVDELVKGPAQGDNKKACFEEGMKRLDQCVFNSNTKTLTVNFLAADTYPSQEFEWNALPALVNTLTHVIPQMEYMAVNIYTQAGEVKVYETSINIPAYGELVRSSVSIYLPNKDLTGLQKHKVSLHAYYGDVAYENIITTILQAKSDGMLNISSMCGLDKIDIPNEILYTRFDGQVIVVNISETLYSAFKTLDKQQEYLLVFAIVNSLCEASNIKRVQFIVNGYTREYFATSIKISAPLIQAHGITVNIS